MNAQGYESSRDDGKVRRLSVKERLEMEMAEERRRRIAEAVPFTQEERMQHEMEYERRMNMVEFGANQKPREWERPDKMEHHLEKITREEIRSGRQPTITRYFSGKGK